MGLSIGGRGARWLAPLFAVLLLSGCDPDQERSQPEVGHHTENVPDFSIVTGLPMERAKTILRNEGYKVETRGSGIVVNQKPSTATPLPGDEFVLEGETYVNRSKDRKGD